ncbi:protein VAPYRIN-LIKE-like [Phoenix dactylifera]|uniref:Protein VAPYRIN-LIKE-like n=1 Tax=Phoenix dactylifera TaxID=42345 RepID=A0A8B8JC07_PHODC|nr:protein VAPYRIN-LIKE-like [Phoenix dactylifera]
MDRLVSVDAKELEIEFRPSQRCSSAAFRVTNLMHTMAVAVHLSTTRPTAFSVHPAAVAVLPPLSSTTFSLLLLPSPSPPLASPPDSLLVRSVLLLTGKPDSPAALLRLFSRAPAKATVFRDAVLPVALVGPHVLRSLLQSRGSLEAAFLLSRAASACSPASVTALLLPAAAAGDHRLVSALLAAGADPAVRGDDRRSALALAIASGSSNAVAALLDAGARVDPAAPDLPFHAAAASGRADLISLLAGSCTDPAWASATGPDGRTPVHAAAAAGHLDAVRLCVASGGGDPDRADSRGWTPLHCASAGGYLDVAMFLIGQSAYDARLVRTRDGRKTPFDLAIDGGHAGLYDALGLGDALHRAARGGDVASVRSCLARGAAVDGRDQNGWTALHRAAFKGRIEVVRALIDGGAQLDAVDHEGYTPLRCAVEAGHAEVALCLVAHGARAGLKGFKGLDLLLNNLSLDKNIRAVDRSSLAYALSPCDKNSVIEAPTLLM